MIEIKSHEFKGNYTHEEVDRALAFQRTGLARRLEKNPAGAGLQVSGCFGSACTAYSLGRIQDALELIDASCDCAGALFAAISAPRDSVVMFRFRDGELSGPSGEPGFGAGPGDWIVDLLLAVARRREDTVDVLRDVELARFEEFRGEYDTCFIRWVAALKLFLEGGDFKPELARADIESQPANLKVATPAIVARFRAIGPVLEAIAEKDQLAFDQSLAAAVQAHKSLFGRGKRGASSDSLIDRISAGLLVLGLERGLQIRVRSSYLPEWLVLSSTAISP